MKIEIFEDQKYTPEQTAYLDQFAIAAMQGFIIREGEYRNNGLGEAPTGVPPSEAAKSAFDFAEAMWQERERRVKG